MSEEEYKKIASQLRCPQGEEGLRVAQMMEAGNEGMVSRTLSEVMKGKNSKILEIGFGNGYHISDLLQQIPGSEYSGIELSSTMLEEAEKRNAALSGRIKLHLAVGKSLPFEDKIFDKVFSVNTLYFWEDVVGYAREISRVLKEGGELLLTFAVKDFMQHLPFTRYQFNLYSLPEVLELLAQASFTSEEVIEEKERVQSKSGESVERLYYVVKFTKKVSR